MASPIVVFLAGLLGGGLGAAAALQWLPASHREAEPVAEGRGLEEVKEQLADLRRLVDRPALSPAPAALPSAARGAGAGGAAKASRLESAEGSLATLTAADLATLVEEAATKAIEKQAAAAKTKAEVPERKRVPLAQAARELGLTAAQENDVRQAYAEAVDTFLKVVSEPESDAETLRREIVAAKDDPAKKAEITGKMLPKLFTKLGDVMKIEADRSRKVNAAVGSDNAKKLRGMKLEEEDPLGLEESFSIGVSASSSDGK